MRQEIGAFIARHRSSADPAVAELLHQLEQGLVHLSTYSSGASSQELAGTYDMRATLAQRSGRDQLATKMQALASSCKNNGNNTCSIWYFAGRVTAYAVFELQPANSIAACLELDGAADDLLGEA